MCEWKGHPDREASETAGPGAITPNVRRVYQLVGTGEDQHKVLICREIDTNLDGIKDVVRHYNDKGESVREEADANYDGKIDTWIVFSKGHLSEVRIDHTGNGNPDEWRYYSGGKLARIKRDTTGNGKANVWEIYQDGKLERMGVDVDGDEHVDRWDHDNEVKRRVDEAERKREEEEAAKKAQADKEAADRAEKDTAADTPGAQKTLPKDFKESSKRQKKKVGSQGASQ
jgi:hypothetical protein